MADWCDRSRGWENWWRRYAKSKGEKIGLFRKQLEMKKRHVWARTYCSHFHTEFTVAQRFRNIPPLKLSIVQFQIVQRKSTGSHVLTITNPATTKNETNIHQKKNSTTKIYYRNMTTCRALRIIQNLFDSSPEQQKDGRDPKHASRRKQRRQRKEPRRPPQKPPKRLLM